MTGQLADRVAFALDKTGMTNDDLAKALGVNRNTISAYRRKRGELKGTLLAGLCESFGFNPNWLLLGDGEIFSSNKNTDNIYPKKQIKPELIYRNNSDNEKHNDTTVLNTKLLEEVLIGVENGLNDLNIELPVEKKSILVSLVYDHIRTNRNGSDVKIISKYLKLIA